MSFNLNNALDDKITVVRGIPGDIVIFGIDGTIADSGVPISIGSGQAKQPTAVPGDLAVFGSGVNQGQTIDSGLTVDDSSVSLPTVLWSSQKIESLIPTGSFLPLAGGTMTGAIISKDIIVPSGNVITLTDAPVSGTSAANKSYVDSQIIVNATPNATSTVLGKIQLTGDLLGSLATFPTVAPGAITLSKLENLSSPSKLIGSGSTSSSPANITLGTSLSMSGTSLNVVPTFSNPTFNGTISGTVVLGVSNGGTGNSTLTGYVVGNGTASFTAVTSIPVSNVNGAVQSVNGIFPDLSGNVTVTLGTVTTGTLAARPPVGPPLVNGDIYVVSGDPTPSNNGLTFIYSTTPTNQWLEISPNFGSLDARYLQLAGGTMSGNIVIPSGNFITLTSLPVNPTDAANKSYVDANITPSATTSIQGKVQLSGDLSGVASAPVITTGAITLTKMANLTSTSSLIGSSSTSTSPSQLSLGSNLQISGTTLNVNTSSLSGTFLPLTGGTMSGNIVISTGDLISIADAPTVGTSAANKAYVDANITPNATTTVLGKIQLSGDFDSTSTATVPVIKSATSSIQGKIQLSGDLTGSSTSPTVTAGAITLAKMANLSGNSQIIGSSSTTSTPTNLTLGSGLQISGTVLSVNSATLAVPPATATTIGGIEMLGDLTGSVATAPTVAAGAITLAKMANLSGNSQIIGSSSTTSTPTNLTLGSGLQISGTVLSVNSATLTVPPATSTSLGGIEMLGDLTGSVATAPMVAAGAITLAKMANLSGNSQIIGSGSTSSSPVNLTLGSGLQISGTVLSVNSATLTVPPATATTIGGIEMLGDLTGSVATAPTIAAGAITLAKMANLSGNSQIIGSSSTASTPTNLTLGSGLQISGTILNVNTTSLSSTFLPLAGGTMSGNIIIPTGDLISIADAPLVGTSGANKSYVDSQIIANATPSATTGIQGKIQLAGDLGGSGTTASSPVISSGAITLTKMANLSGNSQIIGSGSTSSSPVNLTLGSGLQISGTVLSVNSATLTVPPATATTIGGIEMLGDLTGSVATAPTIAAGAITLAKMANLSGTSQLHGSSSTTTSPANISLGSTLQMSGTTLSVNTSTLMLLVPSSVNGDLATLNASGQVIDSGVSINNSGLTSASLWNAAKLAVTTNSWFAGTNPNTTAPTDRPATSNVLYVGTDASLWIWNGTLYISLIGAKVPTATTRTFTTSTGASGFQISSTNGAFVYYSVSISTTIGVGGTSTGTVNLEVSPTNSATPASWIVNGSVSNSQSLAGLLTLTSIQVEGAQLSTYVPAGYFVKLRTISSGTTSFTYVSGIEVLDN